MTPKEKAKKALEIIDIKSNYNWQYNSHTPDKFKQLISIITDDPLGETPNYFAKKAIWEILNTAVVTNCPEKWQPTKQNLTLNDAHGWMNIVPLKEVHLDAAIDVIKKRNNSQDGYLTLISIANYLYQEYVGNKFIKWLQE